MSIQSAGRKGTAVVSVSTGVHLDPCRAENLQQRDADHDRVQLVVAAGARWIILDLLNCHDPGASPLEIGSKSSQPSEFRTAMIVSPTAHPSANPAVSAAPSGICASAVFKIATNDAC